MGDAGKGQDSKGPACVAFQPQPLWPLFLHGGVSAAQLWWPAIPAGSQRGPGGTTVTYSRDEMLELGVHTAHTSCQGSTTLIRLPLFKKIIYIQSFLFGCVGSSLPGFLWLWWVGASLHCSVDSPVAEHRLQGTRAQWRSSQALEQRRRWWCAGSYPVAGGSFQMGMEAMSPAGSQVPYHQAHQGKPLAHFVTENTGPQE